MSNYYIPRKVVIGRHWKRPKPKIYECNVRDTERFYQESYKDYLQNKEFAARRGSEDRSLESKWEGNQRSNLYGESSSVADDSVRSNNSYRSSSIVNSRESPNGELENIEQRLLRLRKLREELGLPTESGNDSMQYSSRADARQLSPSGSRNQNFDSSYNSSLRSGSRSRAIESNNDYSESNQRNYGNEKNSKYSSYTEVEGTAAKPRYSSYSSTDESSLRPSAKYSSYSSSTEESSRPSAKYSSYSSSTEEASRPSAKYSSYSSSTEESSRPGGKSVSFKSSDDSATSSRRLNKYEDEPSETFYKSNTRNKSSSSSNKASALSNMDDSLDNFDDDDYVSKLKKKFVSSEEILERIKKMDNDI